MLVCGESHFHVRMLQELLGGAQAGEAWRAHVDQATGDEPSRIECREYPDTTYINMRWRGTSYQFTNGTLHTIDVYNAQRGWAPYPDFPLEIGWSGERSVRITPETTGIDLVRALGEPSRKGGSNNAAAPIAGHGPSAWLEWALQDDLFLMVELAGKQARAPVGWDSSVGAQPWAVLTLSNIPPC